MAREIVTGIRQPGECAGCSRTVTVRFDCGEMPLNPFFSTLIEKTIRGLLPSMGGYSGGPIEIVVPERSQRTR